MQGSVQVPNFWTMLAMELQKAAEYSHNIENIISYHVFIVLQQLAFFPTLKINKSFLKSICYVVKSRTDQACSVKMAGYSFLQTSNSSQFTKLQKTFCKTYNLPAILTSCVVNKAYLCISGKNSWHYLLFLHLHVRGDNPTLNITNQNLVIQLSSIG